MAPRKPGPQQGLIRRLAARLRPAWLGPAWSGPDWSRPGWSRPGWSRPGWAALALGGAILALLLTLRLLLPQPFLEARHALHDRLQRALPRADLPAPVAVIDLDDESLARLGQWPWPRDLVAMLIEELAAHGAAVIALDVVFAEPDRNSPAAIAEYWRQRGLSALLAPDTRPPDFDDALAATLARHPVVLGYALTPRPGSTAPRRVPGLSVIGPDPQPFLPNYPGSVRNIDRLEEAASGNGHFSAPTAERVIRRLPMLAALQGEILPSLSVEVLRVAQQRPGLALRSMPRPLAGSPTTPTMALRVGALDIPLSAQGDYALHFRRPAPGRMIPAWWLLAPGDAALPDLRPRLEGHLVLIGTSAAGLADLRPTPMNPSEPGVNIHAQALEQILNGQHLLRPLWAPTAELGAALVLAMLAVLVATALGIPAGLLAMAAQAAMLLGGSALALSPGGLMLDPVLPILALLTVHAGVLVQRMLRSERSRRQLRNAFSHYLAPEMVRRLAEHPERLALGGEEREMTFLFTDLEGFTRFAEALPPPELARILNDYLGGLCAVVMAHGGTIDKIVGDAVHAMFNAPLTQPDHASRALRCALAIDAFSESFRARQAAEGHDIGITRIGVNTGRAVVGNFGGAGRFDYTAHGDAINVAARLEAANARLGTRICVAARSAEASSGFHFRPIGQLLLKGKEVPVTCFEPLGEGPEPEETGRQSYRAAYASMARGDGAPMLAHADAFPQDRLAAAHAERLRRADTGAASDLVPAR